MGRAFKSFPHRLLNGVYESICPICFRTVASKANEMDLVFDEVKHLCDPADLVKYEQLRFPPQDDLRVTDDDASSVTPQS
jgi:hypothetical protein